jgi:hypothetical protein
MLGHVPLRPRLAGKRGGVTMASRDSEPTERRVSALRS